MAAKGRPPFSPPQASKPLRLLPSSPHFRSDFFLSKPSTLVGPAAALLLLGLPRVDVSGSKAPETEEMRGPLGVGPIFFPKNGDLWKRFGDDDDDDDEEDEEEERWGSDTKTARLSGRVFLGCELHLALGVVGVVRREEASLADSKILVIESPISASARSVLSALSRVGT